MEAGEPLTPIERAARALDDIWIRRDDDRKYVVTRDGEPVSQPTVTRQEQDEALNLTRVRAVLEAIREPSEDMVREGCLADFPGGRYGEPTFTEAQIGKDDAPVIWQAMIDAALIEGPQC